MSIRVNLMSSLSDYADGKSKVFLEGGCRTVGEVLTALIRLHPALKDELLNEKGKLDYFYQIILPHSEVNKECQQN